MNRSPFLPAIALVGALLILPGTNAGAAPASPADLSVSVTVQSKPKPETVKQKVKRIWRNLTGYKFEVSCPIFPFVVTRTTCTATGKNREDARAKCQSQHSFCYVGDSNR